MPLNPFQYDAIVPYVDDQYDKYIKPYLRSRRKCYRNALEKWLSLTHDEKVEAIELIEEIQNISIVKNIMKGSDEIPIPRLGSFKYNVGKYYFHNNKDELMQLTREERIIRIGQYKKDNRKRYNMRHNGKVFSITKAPTKR